MSSTLLFFFVIPSFNIANTLHALHLPLLPCFQDDLLKATLQKKFLDHCLKGAPSHSDLIFVQHPAGLYCVWVVKLATTLFLCVCLCICLLFHKANLVFPIVFFGM